jgi:hypothetical protein
LVYNIIFGSSTKVVLIMPLVLKLPCPRGDSFPYMYKVKIFCSELTKARGLIFGIILCEVNHYQECSNYSHGVKIGPAPGVIDFHYVHIVNN